MNNYIIRKLENKDYNQYINLITQFRETNFTEKEYLSLLNIINNNSEIFIIEIDNRIIGTGTILYEYKFIRNICKLGHIEDISHINTYCSLICDFLNTNLILDLCKELDDARDFETIFIQVGISSDLDEKSKLLLESRDQLESICKYLNDLIAQSEKKTKTTSLKTSG